MLKKKRLIISIITCACVLMSMFSFPTLKVSAHNGFLTWSNDAKLINGVGSYGDHVRYYWIDSSASSLTDQISQVRYEWVNTSDTLTTSILIRQITNQSSSVFDIYKKQMYPHDFYVVGESFFFDTANQDMGVPTSNYKWTKIILNTSNFNELSDSNKKGTIAHEFGHCMGLAHSTDHRRIMTQLANGRTATKAHYTDLATINHLYG